MRQADLSRDLQFCELAQMVRACPPRVHDIGTKILAREHMIYRYSQRPRGSARPRTALEYGSRNLIARF